MSEKLNLRGWRENLGLSAEEAGQLVYVSRRTWEAWENEEREISRAKLDLLGTKLRERSQDANQERNLVVVVSDEGLPLDVVAEDNFVGLRITGDQAVISSLAVRRWDHKAYVHRTEFSVSKNQFVVLRATKWKSLVSDD